MEKNNNCSEIIESLMAGMDSILSTKTVVGEPTTIGDTIILPLVDVSFGVGAGASMSKDSTKTLGGGGGMSGKLSPSAVLVIKDGYTKLVNVKNQDAGTKILDMIPDVIDKFTSKKEKKKMPSDDTVIKAAFPESDK